MDSVDVIIVGGGIVGLWTAYEILCQKPNLFVVVCEKEMYLGEHSSGRNSEVLHSGIYYQNGSLKHLSCLEGNTLWRQFVCKYQVDFLDCGKFVVATHLDQGRLEQLHSHGIKNQVPGVRWAHDSEVETLRKDVCLDRAFFCPTSGVLNVSSAMKVLVDLIESMGGVILKKIELSRPERTTQGFRCLLGDDFITTQLLINAGGHFAVALREQLGLRDFSNRFVKGNYLTLKKRLNLKSLIYPIPPSHGLGLGVHLTLDTSGAQKFGPDTEEIDKIDYNMNSNTLDHMFPAISQLFPSVSRGDLGLAYAGIRSKIVDTQGVLQKDFMLHTPMDHKIQGYYEFLGIESPGVTAAPSLARQMVANIFS